jgi:hypothetical protein
LRFSSIVFSWLPIAAHCGGPDPTRPCVLGSEIIIRTHKDRPTNKRELLFRRNHRRRAPLVRCQTRSFTLSNANQNNSNPNSGPPQNGGEKTGAAAASANGFPAGFQAIAAAYGDYTKKSFEDTRSFVEKLSGVKSFDKVIEIQTEFAKSAFETFVSESQKISALYGELARQSYKPISGLVAKMNPANR